MSKASVKKALSSLDAAALREVIMELYSARKDAREYLDFWADPDIDRAYDEAVARINKLFYLPSNKPRAKVAATNLSAELKNFKSLCPDPEKTGYLMIHAIDTMFNWLLARDGKKMGTLRPRFDSLIKATRQHIELYELESMMSERLNRLEESIDYFYDNFEPIPNRRGWRRYIRFTR